MQSFNSTLQMPTRREAKTKSKDKELSKKCSAQNPQQSSASKITIHETQDETKGQAEPMVASNNNFNALGVKQVHPFEQ